MTRSEPSPASDQTVLLNRSFVIEQALQGLNLFVGPIIGIAAVMSIATASSTRTRPRASDLHAQRSAARAAYRKALKATRRDQV